MTLRAYLGSIDLGFIHIGNLERNRFLLSLRFFYLCMFKYLRETLRATVGSEADRDLESKCGL